MAFINEDFLLYGATAERLYHTFAAPQPIVDFHCHLPPADLALNRRFRNLFEIWLEGDHYKWRAMRANGVNERYCTGDATQYEKFLAWAQTVPYTLRNPLYHWTHLELARYFGIDDLLDERTAPSVWARANERLARDLTTHAILGRFQVEAICTTDDPADRLDDHQALAASPLRTAVYPCFRPDRALDVREPRKFNEWIARLEATANTAIVRLNDLLDALHRRHDAFHAAGCRLSDHGLERCYAEPCGPAGASAIFDRVRAGAPPDPADADRFAAYLLLYCGRLDAEKGWTKQLHLGALRNTNTRQMSTLGADAGFDSIGDWSHARALASYLDQLDRENALPRLIVYNLNPADNYAFATMVGNFQDGPIPGKIQFGSAWWYLDQKDGITWQLDTLSNAGLLSRFVGMVTDSRSFMSYPRHEYFRRVLCNLIGSEIDRGELPNDDGLTGRLIADVCYHNAVSFLDLPARDVLRAAATAGGSR